MVQITGEITFEEFVKQSKAEIEVVAHQILYTNNQVVTIVTNLVNRTGYDANKSKRWDDISHINKT